MLAPNVHVTPVAALPRSPHIRLSHAGGPTIASYPRCTPPSTMSQFNPVMSGGVDLRTSGVLSSPDPILPPTDCNVRGLSALCVGRGLKLPAHPTVDNLTRLVAAYNAEIVSDGDYHLKRMLQISLMSIGGDHGLSRCVRASMTSFRRGFASEQRAPALAGASVASDTSTEAGPFLASPYLAVARSGLPSPSSAVAEHAVSPRTLLAPDPPSVELGQASSTGGLLDMERARLNFEIEKHRDSVALERKRIDFEETRWRYSLSSPPHRSSHIRCPVTPCALFPLPPPPPARPHSSCPPCG